MGYRIKRNVFAPKVRQLAGAGGWRNAHLVCYERCNYHCGFCDVRNRKRDEYRDYGEAMFELSVRVLMRDGRWFKFTGGEPTLNPTLERDLSIVKGQSGMVFLDTNGSRPEVLSRLLDAGMVDVLALSVKGLDAEEALRVAEVRSRALCWDNVLESLGIANGHPEVCPMLTVVLSADMAGDVAFERIGALMEPYPNVRLKVNNLRENPETEARGLSANDPDGLGARIADFVGRHPEYRDRVVYEPTQASVGDYGQLRFY
jgi:pyruvate-formate lyase-activating enzyme